MTEKNVFENFEAPQGEIAVNPADDATVAENINSMKDAPEFVINALSDNETFDVQLNDADKDKVFVIDTARIQDPVTKDSDGKLIEPKKSNDGKQKYYQSKLKITYKDSSYASFIPNIKWYMRTEKDKTSLSPWFLTKITEEDLSNQFTPAISKLYYIYCKKFGYTIGKLTQKQFEEGLVGKKVKLVQYKGKNPITGKTGYRIDISDFV